MTQYLRTTFLILLSFVYITNSFSQKDSEKTKINTNIEYANRLVWHINYNLRGLRNFQDELILWAENPTRKLIDKPEYTFIRFSGEKMIINQKFDAKNTLFDYNYQLDKIDKQILELNIILQRIESLKYSFKNLFEEKKSMETLEKLINTVNTKSLKLAEASYDFSRSCAINYKSNDYPTQLAKVKNVISQSKNLILAIRSNDKELSKEYLNLLSNAIEIMEKTTNVRELYILSKSSLTLEENHDLIIEIYHKAFNISSWGELYLQSNFSEKEINLLLQSAISEFNEAEGKMGCASGFNTILQYSKHELMLYTEEPNSIIAEKIIPVERNRKANQNMVATVPKEVTKPKPVVKEPIANTQAEVKEPLIIVTEKPIVHTAENPPIVIKEKFDKKNNNSLAGSLPNNLILLLDVSASMKKSKKLPVLKKSISHFLNLMREEDKISLITYSGETKVLISGGSKNNKYEILDTLSKVKSSGGSDVYNALQRAYKIGKSNFIKNGNNKIIIASDGIFGVDYSILKLVNEKTQEDFTLSVFQYCNEGEETNFKSLKNLASKGNGSYKLIFDSNQSINVMMQEIKKQATY